MHLTSEWEEFLLSVSLYKVCNTKILLIIIIIIQSVLHTHETRLQKKVCYFRAVNTYSGQLPFLCELVTFGLLLQLNSYSLPILSVLSILILARSGLYLPGRPLNPFGRDSYLPGPLS